METSCELRLLARLLKCRASDFLLIVNRLAPTPILALVPRQTADCEVYEGYAAHEFV